MKKIMARTRAKDVDGYLAMLPEGTRKTLEKLRTAIKAAAPEASESISYGVPVFKLNGMLVGFAGFQDHCSFFVMSPTVMRAHKEALKAYDTAKGTVRFPFDRPLPTMLVKRLVKARIAENQKRRNQRRKSKQ